MYWCILLVCYEIAVCCYKKAKSNQLNFSLHRLMPAPQYTERILCSPFKLIMFLAIFALQVVRVDKLKTNIFPMKIYHTMYF